MVLRNWFATLSVAPPKLTSHMSNPVDTSESRSLSLGKLLWYVFGTAGLMVVFAAGLVACSPWHRQGQAIAEIRRRGGAVYSQPGGPEWLRNIVGDDEMTGFDHVGHVQFIDVDVDETGLSYLDALAQPRHLWIENSRLPSSGLSLCNGLADLKSLNLLHTNFDDAGMPQIGGLTKLECLTLNDSQVTDAGLMHLRGLTGLRYLSFMGTEVTDAGAKELQTVLHDSSR